MTFETNEPVYRSYPYLKMCSCIFSVYNSRELRLPGLWIIHNSFYYGKKYWTEIRKLQNHSSDLNEQLPWPRSEVIEANNHSPSTLGRHIEKQRLEMLQACPLKSTSVQLNHNSKYAVGTVQALDYNNGENKHDPYKELTLQCYRHL